MPVLCIKGMLRLCVSKVLRLSIVVSVYGACVLSSHVALADATEEISTIESAGKERPSRVYLGLGLGMSRLDPDTSEVQTFSVNDRVGAGASVNVGVDINKPIALELHAADLGSAGLSPRGEIHYRVYGASALLYLPLGSNDVPRRNMREGFNLFGRLGVGRLENKDKGDLPFLQTNSTHVLLGAGVEYQASNGFGVRAEVTSFDEDVLYGQLAILYRLGGRAKQSVVQDDVQLASQSGTDAEIGDSQSIDAGTVATLSDSGMAENPEIESRAGLESDSAAEGRSGVQVASDECLIAPTLLKPIYFATNSSRLNNDSLQILLRLGESLRDCKTLELVIAGHTDSRGSHALNQTLSQKRASATAQYLTDMGVVASRLDSRGFGELNPISSNGTREGRQLNRRVELSLR